MVLLYLGTNQLIVFRWSDFPKPLQTQNHLQVFIEPKALNQNPLFLSKTDEAQINKRKGR